MKSNSAKTYESPREMRCWPMIRTKSSFDFMLMEAEIEVTLSCSVSAWTPLDTTWPFLYATSPFLACCSVCMLLVLLLLLLLSAPLTLWFFLGGESSAGGEEALPSPRPREARLIWPKERIPTFGQLYKFHLNSCPLCCCTHTPSPKLTSAN